MHIKNFHHTKHSESQMLKSKLTHCYKIKTRPKKITGSDFLHNIVY